LGATGTCSLALVPNYVGNTEYNVHLLFREGPLIFLAPLEIQVYVRLWLKHVIITFYII